MTNAMILILIVILLFCRVKMESLRVVQVWGLYTPQNNLRTNAFIFPLFNIEIKVYSFFELICGQKRYLQYLFKKAEHVGNISSSQQKILRKLGISETMFYPKMKIFPKIKAYNHTFSWMAPDHKVIFFSEFYH